MHTPKSLLPRRVGPIGLCTLWLVLGSLAAADDPARSETALKLKQRQQQLAAKFERLQVVLLRMAELTEATDPSRAAVLKQAVRMSKERLIAAQFDSMVDLLAKDRLARASENQKNLEKDLGKLLELLLSENRAERLESEKARIRQYLKRLNQIIKQQKGIQGRTAGTGKAGPLGDEQQKLARKTGDLAEQIKQDEEPAPQEAEEKQATPAEKPKDSPPEEGKGSGSGKPSTQENTENGEKKAEGGGKKGEGASKEPKARSGKPQGDQGGPSKRENPNSEGRPQEGSPPRQGQEAHPARRHLEAAKERMRQARKKLEEAKREGAAQEQEEAIGELERAKATLEEILRQLREEEIERMLTLLETRFQKMLQMQRDVYEGTLRLDAIPQPDRDHSQVIEAARLSRKEAAIVFEADKALTLLRDDGTAVAFPEALRQARADMRQVVERLDSTKVGPLTQAVEEEILAALEEMLESLKQAKRDSKTEPPPGMMGPPGTPRDQALVDLLSEIRMIRAMQMRVNRRTERYSKLVAGEQAENPDLLEALDELAKRQERIFEITRDLEKERKR